MLTLKQLNTLSELVSKEIPNINYGGCCVFASLVGKHLQQIKPIRFAVLSGPWFCKPTTIDEARQLVSKNTLYEWNNNNVYFGHVLMEFDYRGKTYYYDSTGVENKDDDCRSGDQIKGFLTLKECQELADDTSGWNSCFNRKHIPQMKKIIDTFFDQLDVDLQQAA